MVSFEQSRSISYPLEGGGTVTREKDGKSVYSYARWENVSSARVFMDYGPEITTETEIFIDDLLDNERFVKPR